MAKSVRVPECGKMRLYHIRSTLPGMQMKHDLQAFSRDTAALMKASGGSGTLPRSRCSSRTFLSPLTRRSCPPSKTSEDRPWWRVRQKNVENCAGCPQCSRCHHQFRRGARSANFRGHASRMACNLEELKAMQAPEWAGTDRWFQIIENAEAFLSIWGRAARDLGGPLWICSAFTPSHQDADTTLWG